MNCKEIACGVIWGAIPTFTRVRGQRMTKKSLSQYSPYSDHQDFDPGPPKYEEDCCALYRIVWQFSIELLQLCLLQNEPILTWITLFSYNDNTNYLLNGVPRKVCAYSAAQGIAHILRNWMIQFRVHKMLPWEPILSQLDPVPNYTLHYAQSPTSRPIYGRSPTSRPICAPSKPIFTYKALQVLTTSFLISWSKYYMNSSFSQFMIRVPSVSSSCV